MGIERLPVSHDRFPLRSSRTPKLTRDLRASSGSSPRFYRPSYSVKDASVSAVRITPETRPRPGRLSRVGAGEQGTVVFHG